MCASHEAVCHAFWTHEEWLHNLLLHTSDEHFLKVTTAYKKFCVNGAKKGVCGVCGVTGLQNRGTKIPLERLRFLILRGDEYDDSKYGKFTRELRAATTPKEIATAKLRLDTLHTYTHPTTGAVYPLCKDGVINDESCLVCSTCKTSVSFAVVPRYYVNVVFRRMNDYNLYLLFHIQHSVSETDCTSPRPCAGDWGGPCVFEDKTAQEVGRRECRVQGAY